MSENTQTLGFQTEVKQLLHLMIHSLYSNREVFLRELISNASDANDRLRFASVSAPDLLESQPDLEIRVECDADARTVTITDTGIGMSRDEVISNLGTIARSGTGEFLKQLSGDQKKDAGLIGQFGVGFYSSFIVADRVQLYTRKAGAPITAGVRWVSDGQGEFTIEDLDREQRGTTVVLHLREDASEFADPHRLRGLIRRYSDHIGFPVKMPSLKAAKEDAAEAAESETVNSARALWTRSRTEIKDDEYQDFYKHISHDFRNPLAWSHNKVEGKREYTMLLYLPAQAPFDLWNRETPRGLKLYIQRVFVMDDAAQFLPSYLRFVRGVIDAADLPLNVSREMLQQNAAVEGIKTAVTKRVLDMMQQLATDQPEKYQGFWKEFGRVLKEGPVEDHANREKIAGLLRFSTTHTDSETQDQSLDDYIARKQETQDKIYYILAENFGAAKSSPHLEILRKRGIEVLLLSDPIDEWLVNNLPEYKELKLSDAARGELELNEDPEQAAQREEQTTLHKDLLERLTKVLEQDVESVRVTSRLTESPACLVLGDQDISVQMRRIMEASGQHVPESKPVLEINTEHPLVIRLGTEKADERFADLARIIIDQAVLAEGRALKDPGAYVRRLNKLLLDLSA